MGAQGNLNNPPDTQNFVGAIRSRDKFFHNISYLFISHRENLPSGTQISKISEAQISKIQPIPPEGVVSAIPNVKLNAQISFIPPRGLFRSSKRFDIFFSEKRTHFRFSCAVCAVFLFPPYRGNPGIRIPQSQSAFPLSDNWDRAFLRLVGNDFNVLEDSLLCFKPCP